MQVFSKHQKVVVIALILVGIIIVSFFIVQNSFKPSSKPTPTSSPMPTRVSPTPTRASSSPTTLQTQTPKPTPTPTQTLYQGEVTTYQGQDIDSISDFLQELASHPDVSIEGVQNINQSTYRLNVTDLVTHPLSLTYGDIVNNFTLQNDLAALSCVEGWSVTCLWQGVLVSDLLKEAGVNPSATTLIFTASDGYTTALPLNYTIQNNLILAYKINNVTLPAAAGFPLTIIVPNQYGYKWIMWVTQIDVSNDSSYLGYWESQGYPNNATIP